MNIKNIGFSGFFEAHFCTFKDTELCPARVVNEQKGRYRILCEQGELSAEVSGKFIHEASVKADFPAVGDWVAVKIEGEMAIIHNLLPRKSSFSRNVASSNKRNSGGVSEEQVVAANIDTVFIVTGLDDNYSLSRIERYMVLAWNSGAKPVIVLSKADLCENVDEIVDEVEQVTFGVPVHAVSAKTGGVEELKAYAKAGESIALLGSSGVGKSTIVNCFLGYERQKVSHVSDAVHKGRHTTTSRELIVLEGGGILIDTPGMREIQLWADEEAVSNSFEDVEALAAQCRFGDCSHDKEPGCAVREAIEDGRLSHKRYKQYLKITREVKFLEERKTKGTRQIDKEFTQKVINANKNKKKFR